MADILIRGMGNIPVGQEFVIVENIDFERYLYNRETGAAFHLVPLPEGHGRLGDLDALDRAFTDLRFNSDGTLNHWGDRPGWCMHGYEVEKLIADAPTIVPAEGGTDDDGNA